MQMANEVCQVSVSSLGYLEANITCNTRKVYTVDLHSSWELQIVSYILKESTLCRVYNIFVCNLKVLLLAGHA